MEQKLNMEMAYGTFYNPMELLEQVDGVYLFNVWDVLDNSFMCDLHLNKEHFTKVQIEKVIQMDSKTLEKMIMYPNKGWNILKVQNEGVVQVDLGDGSSPILVKSNKQGRIQSISVGTESL